MLAASFGNWRYVAAIVIDFERDWDASTASFTGSSVNSGSTNSSTSPWGTPFIPGHGTWQRSLVVSIVASPVGFVPSLL